MKKKLLLIVLSIMVVLAFTACGGGSSSDEGSGGGAAAGQTFELKLADVYPEDHADTIACRAAVEEIEEKTGGAVKIKVYPANQLGDASQVYEEIRKGTIDMMLGTLPTTFDSRMEMLTIPYLVTNYDQAKKTFLEGSYFYDQLNTIQNELDVELINIFMDGFMGVGATKPLEDPMDFTKKHKELIRVPAMDSYIWTAQGMGYNTTTIPYADLYSALQTGVADGWIGGSAYVNYESFGDIIKSFCESNYIMELIPIVMNKGTFDSMPEEYQTIIKEAFATQAVKVADDREALDAQAIKDLEKNGAEIYTPSQDELDAMSKHFQEDIWPKYKDVLGEELLNGIMESVQANS